jgi:hypothetical protein
MLIANVIKLTLSLVCLSNVVAIKSKYNRRKGTKIIWKYRKNYYRQSYPVGGYINRHHIVQQQSAISQNEQYPTDSEKVL